MSLFARGYLFQKVESGANFILICVACLFYIATGLLNTVSASSFQKTTLCEKNHLIREKLINTEPAIDLKIPLRLSDSASCFSPEENLFFVALIAAQNELGPNAPWYKQLHDDSQERSTQACIILGYDQNNTTKNLSQCVQEHVAELMQPHKHKYMQASWNYIKKRNAKAHMIMQTCMDSFLRYLPDLPDNIYFPLAYYDSQLHSWPDWYVKKRIHDEPWLQNMKNIKGSDIVKQALGNACPGEMIWWLYAK